MQVPSSWEEISEKQKKALKCDFGYTKTEGKIQKAICVYQINAEYEKIIKEMEQNLSKIRHENSLVDGDPNDEDYESTATIFPIYFSNIKIDKKPSYLNVSNFLIDKHKYKTLLQIIFKKDSKTYSIQFEIDYMKDSENDVYNKLKTNELFNEVLNYIKSF